MSWSCRRPGCNREAAVCISYDTVACQVWLDPIAIGPTGGQPLCEQHASRLSAPRGWVVLDRRESQSNLMTAGGDTSADPGADRGPRIRRPLSRGWGQFDAPTLDFVVEESSASDPVAVAVAAEATEVPIVTPSDEAVDRRAPEVAAAAGAPANPRTTPRNTPRVAPPVDPPAKPKGRLLSRAFESVGAQRSVITESLSRATNGAPPEPPVDGPTPE